MKWTAAEVSVRQIEIADDPLYFSSQWLLATLPSLGRVLLSLHRQSKGQLLLFSLLYIVVTVLNTHVQMNVDKDDLNLHN